MVISNVEIFSILHKKQHEFPEDADATQQSETWAGEAGLPCLKPESFFPAEFCPDKKIKS